MYALKNLVKRKGSLKKPNFISFLKIEIYKFYYANFIRVLLDWARINPWGTPQLKEPEDYLSSGILTWNF